MSGADFRQQQELEEERQQRAIESLQRVDHGTATHDDVLFLAAELGLTERIKEVA